MNSKRLYSDAKAIMCVKRKARVTVQEYRICKFIRKLRVGKVLSNKDGDPSILSLEMWLAIVYNGILLEAKPEGRHTLDR